MTNAIRILGLEPGLRRTGWGVVAVDGARLNEYFLQVHVKVPRNLARIGQIRRVAFGVDTIRETDGEAGDAPIGPLAPPRRSNGRSRP